MLKKYITSLLFLIGSILYSQNCNLQISGEITDLYEENGISSVYLIIRNISNSKKISTKTNEFGKYSFNDLCEGKYELVINSDDYLEKIIELKIHQNTIQNIELEQSFDERLLEGVTIEKTKTQIIITQEKIISNKKINDYSETNLGTALKEISGVSSLSTGNHIVKPVIHGLHSGRVAILNNGIRQEDQQWGVEHAPNIDINSLNSLKVIKGSGAFQYAGDAIGGIILAEPKKLTDKDTIFGDFIGSWIDNGKGGNITSRIEKGFKNGIALRIQGTYKKLGDLKAPDYNLSNTSMEEKDFSTLIGYNNNKFGINAYYSFFNTEIGILKASHIGSLEELIYAINSKYPTFIESYSSRINPPKQKINHHLAKISSYYKFSLGELSLSYAYQYNTRKEYDNRRVPYNGIPSVDLELKTQTLNINFDHKNILGFEGKLGVSLNNQKNYPNPDTGVNPLIPDYVKYNVGAYLIENYHLNNNFSLEAGIRYDYNKIDAYKFYKKERWKALGYDKLFPELVIKEVELNYLTHPILEYNSIATTFGFNWMINNNNKFIFNYALSNRAPNVSELFSDGLHHSASAIELGDIQLKNEKSNKFIVTLNSQFIEDKLKIELSAYYNIINDYINQIPVSAEYTNRGAFPVWQYIQTNAEIFGFDFDANFVFHKNWEIQNIASYVYGQDTGNDIALINIPATNFINSIKYKNDRWNDFYMKLTSKTVLKQNHYPNYNFSLPVLENGIEVNKILDISTPPPSYQLFDVESGFSLDITDKNKLSISLALNNIFDMSYRDYLSRLRYYSDEMGRNVIMKIKYNF